MFLYYHWHVFGGYVGVPNIVGEHEDDRPLLVSAGASVAQNGRRRKSPANYLFPEPLEEFATAFGPTPALPGRGADEDLSRYSHPYILCGVRLMAIDYWPSAVSCGDPRPSKRRCSKTPRSHYPHPRRPLIADVSKTTAESRCLSLVPACSRGGPCRCFSLLRRPFRRLPVRHARRRRSG